MKPAAAFLALALAALPEAAAAQAERTWTEFKDAGVPPAVPLPKTAGIPIQPLPAVPSRAEDVPALSPPEAPTSTSAPVPRPAASAPRHASDYQAGMRIEGVAKIVDGHTLHVSGHAVRLHGLEAPGLAQTCRTRAGTTWPCGKMAYARLERLAGGQQVSCMVVESVGDGAAAVCSVRGISDLSRIMAEEGWGVPNGHGNGRYAAAAAAAKASGAGLWSGTFEAPWTFRRRQ